MLGVFKSVFLHYMIGVVSGIIFRFVLENISKFVDNFDA